MPQELLFTDPKPLVKRLGKKFFQQLPKRPGVYLMRDAQENILYVGKAKNLRQRLNSYRIANPDKMGPRHLKLLRLVARIEFKLCRDENAALAKEAELLRSIRPKFNRAGVWPTKAKSLLWRIDGSKLLLKIADADEPEWNTIGPLKGVHWLRMSLVRLMWMTFNKAKRVHDLPAGWQSGKIEDVEIEVSDVSEIISLFQELNHIGAQRMINWIRKETCSGLTSFESAWLEAELETLGNFKFERIGIKSVTDQIKDEQRMFAFV